VIPIPDRPPLRRVDEVRPPKLTICPWCHLPNDPAHHPAGLWDRHIAYVAEEVAIRIMGAQA